MLLTVVDPALLIYRYEDWKRRTEHCQSRFDALTLHRQMMRSYSLKMVLSNSFEAAICQSFPWNHNCQSIPQLQDIRRFLLEDLQKAHRVHSEVTIQVAVRPSGIVCQYIDDEGVIDTWKQLLCSCIGQADSTESDPQVATWETSALLDNCGAITVTMCEEHLGQGDRDCRIPLVWDDDTWFKQLDTQDWWPNLQRCMEVSFKTNPGFKNFPSARVHPVPIECTEAFLKSLERFCRDRSTRESLVDALTKRVHGILDVSLGDESFGEMRRFRVTDFWRVHYREEENRIVLLEFGPHGMGGVD